VLTGVNWLKQYYKSGNLYRVFVVIKEGPPWIVENQAANVQAAKET